MAADRMSGTVKWFSRVKGYGFIAPDGEESEIFVHFTGIEGEGYRNLEKGEKVSFVVEDTEKGPQAVQVRAEGFDVTSWTAEPTDESANGGGETSWRAEEEDMPEVEALDEPEMEVSGTVDGPGGDDDDDFDDEDDEDDDFDDFDDDDFEEDDENFGPSDELEEEASDPPDMVA